MQEIIPTDLRMEVKESHISSIDGIFAFVEKPSLNCPQKKEETGNIEAEINASELFSLFTADIIKEKIIFTR
jgi:hypothetical protein